MREFANLALRFAAAAVVAALCGCTTLLPTSKKEVVSAWTSYDEAVKSLSAIEPYTATRDQIHTQGLDPSVNPAITVLHFGDVLQRFSAAALIKPEDVDRGIRDCLHAGKQCNGYAISVPSAQQSPAPISELVRSFPGLSVHRIDGRDRDVDGNR